MKKRVVITGLGIVSPVGNNLEIAWKNIKNGISGIDNISHFDASDCVTKFAGEVKNLSIDGFIDIKDANRMDKFIKYGIIAGVQAVKDAKLDSFDKLNKERVGIIIGSGIGGLPYIEETVNLIKDKGVRRVSPFFITGSIANMVAGNLSIKFGFKGINYGIVSACATGNHSIGDALRYIQNDECDVVLAGGSEGAICKVGIAGFNACKALSTRNDDPKTASRPFDKDRDGFVMGEGSAVLILEEYEHAIKRGANIYAELIGFGATADAFHITAPSIDGPKRSMQLAIKNANIAPNMIDYINAHGTSTPPGDINETNAMKECFVDHAKKVSVSSTKSMTGHLLGAAAAIEAVFTVMSIKENIIPPTINIFNQDEKCDLDYTPNVAKEKMVNYAMTNSFGFGGTNSTLIFKKITI